MLEKVGNSSFSFARSHDIIVYIVHYLYIFIFAQHVNG